MKNIFLTLAAAVLMTTAANAQNYEKLFYKDATKETSDFTFTIDNAVSTPAETKFKFKITNKTSDYLIYKPTESKFVINGKEGAPKEKQLIIKPNSSDFVTVNLKGSGYNAVKNYSYIIDGIYKVSTNGTVINTPNFKLPPAQNEFKTGDFTCTMGNLTKETDKTEVKFKCSYNGDKVGIISQTKASVKMPDGSEFANAKKPGLLDSKSREVLVLKGETESIELKWNRMEGGKSMDMQKVSMDIIWNAWSLNLMKQKLLVKNSLSH
jgi:hypothetical protein